MDSFAKHRCINWCNNRGYCTAASDGHYCVCDAGFTGDDCSQRMCPKSYDVLTLDNYPNRRTVRIMTGIEGGELHAGSYSFSFSGSSVDFNADSNKMTSEMCTQRLTQMKSFGDAICTREKANPDGTGSYTIRINSFPLMPSENNMFTHTGNPSIGSFKCNMTATIGLGALSPYCSVIDVETKDLPEYKPCGGHGSCNSLTGVCQCMRGYHGLACTDIDDSKNIWEKSHDGPFFTGSLVQLHVNREQSNEFNYLHILDRDLNDVTTIQGDGRFTQYGEVESKEGYISNINEDGMSRLALSSHFVGMYAGEEMISINAGGDIITQGSLLIANNTLMAHDSLVTMVNAHVEGDLTVDGSISMTDNDEFKIGDTYKLSNNGISMKFDDVTNGSLMSLQSTSKNFDGTLFDIETTSTDATLFKAAVNGVTRLEIGSNGIFDAVGMKVRSGGVSIGAGGITIEGGGISVKGGLSVQSGGLHIPNQMFKAGQIYADNIIEKNDNESVDIHSTAPILSSKNSRSNFAGALLELTNNGSGDSFSYINAKSSHKADASVFNIASDGSFTTSGGIDIGNNLKINGATAIGGTLSVKSTTITAADVISIPSDATYVEITDDGEDGKNELKFNPSTEVTAGRVVVVHNKDSTTVSFHGQNSYDILPNMALMFIHDSIDWKALDAAASPMTSLNDITDINAANDIHIGNHTLSASYLRSSEIPEGHIVISGPNGILLHAPGLSWTKGILTAPALKINKIMSDIDGRGFEIKNVKLNKAIIYADEIRMSSVDSVGVAVFDEHGVLSGKRISLNKDGDLDMAFSAFSNDINGSSYTLSNITLNDVTFDEDTSISVKLISAEKITSNLLSVETVQIREGNVTKLKSESGVIDALTTTSIASKSASIDKGTFISITSDSITSSGSIESKTLKTGSITSEDIHGVSIISKEITSDSITNNGEFKSKSVVSESAVISSLKVENLAATSLEISTLAKVTLKDAIIESSQSISSDSITSSGSIESKTLKTGSITSESITTTSTSSTSIEVDTHKVNKYAEFNGEVYMEKGLTVQGTVVGSGPYVDSSDLRFKKNINELNGRSSLDIICKLRSVSYNLKVDEYPERNFSNTTQIGWIAQEVEILAPELVEMDKDGYRAVSYARSTALLASAIAELRQEFNDELDLLRQEIKQLKNTIINIQ